MRPFLADQRSVPQHHPGTRDIGTDFRHRFFDPAVQRAGLAPLTPHDLRDTAASLAVAAGASVKAVQRMLGHASAAMTLDVYAGLFDEELIEVADRMGWPAEAAGIAGGVSTQQGLDGQQDADEEGPAGA
jgi:integrase